jgi:hypothetical protein
VIHLLLVAGSLLYGLGTLSATIPRWSALYLFTIYVLIRWALKGRAFKEVEQWTIVLVGYFGLSLLWSEDWREGFVHFVNAACLGVLFIHVRDTKPQIGWTMVPICLAAVALAFVFPEDTGGFGNRNFITEFLLLALPLSFLAPWSVAIPLAVLVLGYLVFFNGSHIEFLVMLGWFAGLFCFLTNAKRWECFALLALGLLAMFILIPAPHFMARYELWLNTLAMWWDNPFLGVGLGGFDAAYHQYREFHVQYLGTYTLLGNAADYAGAAHNDFLQILAELGIVGFALCLGWALCVIKIHRGRPETWALLGLAAMCMIGFPLQNPATCILAATCLGLASE